MALISDLVTELSVMSGIERKSIAVIARRLREAGLLSQKGRGRGAAHATPLDAARLCIALMIGGKTKDAPDVVADFGELVCHNVTTDREKAWSDVTLASACGLGERHSFEQALTGLIGLWGDDKVVSQIDARRQEHEPWPVMVARLMDATVTGEVYLGGSRYHYVHPALLQPAAGGEPEESLASMRARSELRERWIQISERYRSGISSTREISTVEIKPLGEVVADLRVAGERDADDERADRNLARPLISIAARRTRTTEEGPTASAQAPSEA